MSNPDDTQPTRGRPVLKHVEGGWINCAGPSALEELDKLASQDKLWIFCGEFDASEQKAADAAHAENGKGIYKVFPSGSWPGGYLRD